jgi:hypothetical protein
MTTVYSNKIIVSVQAGTTQYDLHVLVENMAGASIVGATVTVGGKTATTNNLGYVDIYLPPGTYTVTASASGYQTASKTINLQGNYSLIIQLQSTTTTGNCTFNINASVSYGYGYVSPTSATVTSSQSATFTAYPQANYQFASWEIVLNGQSNISLTNPLTLTYGDLIAMQPCSNSNTYSVSLKARFIPKNVG